MNDLIRIRRDTYTNWESANPVLPLGEITYDRTNAEIRVGDGTSNWLSLPTIGSASLADGKLWRALRLCHRQRRRDEHG